MKRAQITRANAPGGRVPPTFALLWEKRSLAVCNPENGARFTISLRNWQRDALGRARASGAEMAAARQSLHYGASNFPARADRGLAGGIADDDHAGQEARKLHGMMTGICCLPCFR